MSEREADEQALVELVVRALSIIEELTAAGHQHEQTATGGVVVLVLSEVLSEVGNTLGKDSHLESGGASVLLIHLEVVDVDFAHCRVSCV